MGVWRVVGACGRPGMAIGRAGLVVIDCASSLNRGCGAVFWEGTGQQQWRGWFRGQGAFGSFSSLTGQGTLAMAVATVMFRHVWVIHRAVVPIIGMPLRQDAVGVMAVDMWGRTPVTPMAHVQAVETEPLRCHIHTHHVAWTTPSDDNCRRAVDGT
jgi:hypothetical protein